MSWGLLYDVRLSINSMHVLYYLDRDRARQSYWTRLLSVLSNDNIVELLSSQRVTAAQRPIKREADATHVYTYVAYTYILLHQRQ